MPSEKRVGLTQLHYYQQDRDPVRGNLLLKKIFCLYGGTMSERVVTSVPVMPL